MRVKPSMFVLLLGLLSLILPSTLFAQEPALNETYTASVNSFTVKYPTGWSPTFTPDIPTDVIFFPSDGSATTLAVQISKTDARTLNDAVAMMKQQLSMTEDPTVIEANGWQMLYIEGGQFNTLDAAVLFDNGMIAFVIGNVEPANKDEWKQVVIAAAASIDMIGAKAVGGTAAPAEAAVEATPAPTAASLQPAQAWTVKMRGDNIQDVAFSPDGKLVAAPGSLATSGQPTNDIVILNAADGTLWNELVGHTSLIYRLAFSPDGTLLASTSSDGSLRLWDVAGTEKLKVQLDGQLKSLAFNPDGTSIIFMTNGNPNTIWLLDVASGKEQIIYSRDDGSFTVNQLILSPDGNVVVFDAAEYTNGDAHAVVYQLDLTTQAETKVFDQPETHPLDIFYTADGQLLSAVTPNDTKTTQVWDVSANNLMYTLPPAQTSDGSEVGTVRTVLNPAGTILATISINTDVQLFDAQTGTLLGTLNRNIDVGQDGPQAIAFSQDGIWAVSSYLYSGVYLWNLSGGAGQTQTDTSATPTETSTGSCTITATKPANLRGGPDTSYPKTGSLIVGHTVEITGQAQSADGKTWYRTGTNKWIRSDLVDAPAECASVTILTP